MKVCSIQSCPGKVQAASPGRYLPDFFSGLYVPRAEEGDPGEAEVLVRHEDSHRNEVWLTEVVYKAADVAIETGIYAVHLSILEGEMLHVSLDEIGFRVITATCLKKKKESHDRTTSPRANTLQSLKKKNGQGRLKRTKHILLHSAQP